ncbi:hypothetical protein E1262_27255 [Jiangella aurantiaca]|uniref:Uncharacterized protein n=1 Tax=Jiangella aurantiaca TaxID=2530373 RepID=A0A4R4ZZA3_9ACTN|nr:hypothetical protein [Jiangella aurantiaca]TDD64788.1 hypothetical protein E1262_27255 [Jiangella aurantiaca]
MAAINVRVREPDSCVIGIYDLAGDPLPVGKWRPARGGWWNLRITTEDAAGGLEIVLRDTPAQHPVSCFSEVETDDGRMVRIGQSRRREDNRWVLRITAAEIDEAVRDVDQARAEDRHQLAPLMREIQEQNP